MAKSTNPPPSVSERAVIPSLVVDASSMSPAAAIETPSPTVTRPVAFTAEEASALPTETRPPPPLAEEAEA